MDEQKLVEAMEKVMRDLVKSGDGNSWNDIARAALAVAKVADYVSFVETRNKLLASRLELQGAPVAIGDAARIAELEAENAALQKQLAEVSDCLRDVINGPRRKVELISSKVGLLHIMEAKMTKGQVIAAIKCLSRQPLPPAPKGE